MWPFWIGASWMSFQGSKFLLFRFFFRISTPAQIKKFSEIFEKFEIFWIFSGSESAWSPWILKIKSWVFLETSRKVGLGWCSPDRTFARVKPFARPRELSHLRRNLRRLKRWQPKYNKSTVASGIVFILRPPPEVDFFPICLQPEVDFPTGSGTGSLNLNECLYVWVSSNNEFVWKGLPTVKISFRVVSGLFWESTNQRPESSANNCVGVMPMICHFERQASRYDDVIIIITRTTNQNHGFLLGGFEDISGLE